MKEGYKETEIGLIPPDWEVKSIGSFAFVTAGGTPSTAIPEYWNGEIPWMNSGEINQRRVKSVENKITELGLVSSSTKIIPKHAILIALAGQGKTRGKVASLEIETCINQSLAAIYKLKNVDPEFLFQNLESRYHELRKMSTGDGGRGGLNLQIIKSVLVAIPNIHEQQKIAEILSTVDDKLDIIEEKIKETQQLKQSLMQTLLTKGIGHTEFKDSPLGKIPVSWEVTTLKNVLKSSPEYGANASAQPYNQDTVRYLRITDIDEAGKLIVANKVGVLRSIGIKYLLKHNDILIARTGNTVGKSYLHDQKNGECAFAGYLIRFTLDVKQFLPELLIQILHSRYYYDWIKSTLRTGAQPNINSQEYQTFVITKPPLSEQKEIASILTAVDEKLGVMQEKKVEYTELKKGLMQQLLTGKIRVNQMIDE